VQYSPVVLHGIQLFFSKKLVLPLHLFNDLFSKTTQISRYQKGKTSLDLNEARDDGALEGRKVESLQKGPKAKRF